MGNLFGSNFESRFGHSGHFKGEFQVSSIGEELKNKATHSVPGSGRGRSDSNSYETVSQAEKVRSMSLSSRLVGTMIWKTSCIMTKNSTLKEPVMMNCKEEEVRRTSLLSMSVVATIRKPSL